MGDVNKYSSSSGTSMASPCVAAVAGLLKKAHMDWTPESIRLALANTSTVLRNPINNGVITWALQGAGRINVPAAFNTNTLIYTLKNGSDFKYSGLLGKFGEGAGMFSQNVFINNISENNNNYNISFNWTSKYNDGVNYALSANNLMVGPKSVASFNISFSNQNSKNISYEGVINVTGGKEVLHIPVILWKGNTKVNKLVDNVFIDKSVFNPSVDKTNKISFSLGYGSVAIYDGEYSASNLVPSTIIRIYDNAETKILGTIFNEEMLFMGNYEFAWDGKDFSGKWFLKDGDYKLRISVLEGNNDTKNLIVEEKDYVVLPIKIVGTLDSTVFIYPEINGTPKTNWFTVININISSNASLSSISGEIALEKNLLKYSKTVRGDLISSNSSIKLTTSYDEISGILKFKAIGKITGIGTILSIKVEVVGSGVINSSLENIDIRDIYGIGMPYGSNTESVNTVMRTMDWDVNSDRIIDVKDLLLIARAYGFSIGSARYCPEADINKDGTISSSDFSKMTGYFGNVYP
jgi:minor extracellular serine protease Vpr